MRRRRPASSSRPPSSVTRFIEPPPPPPVLPPLGGTGGGGAVAVTALVAELLAGSISATSERVATVALALTAPLLVATALNVNVCDPPTAIVPNPQDAPPLLAVQPLGNVPSVNADPRVKVTFPSFDA